MSIDGRTGRLDDVVGHGFMLIADIDVTAALSNQQQRFLAELGCHVLHVGVDLVDEEGFHTDYLRQLGAVAYLARPDFVLYGTAATSAEVAALVDDLRSALAWAPATTTVRA